MPPRAEVLPVPGRLGWRVLARVVDTAILVWLAAVVVVELRDRLLGGDPLARQPLRSDGGELAWIVGVTLLYEVGFLTVTRATPGKAFLGLRVVEPEALGPPGPLRALVRWLALDAPLIAALAAPGALSLLVPWWLLLLVSASLLPDRRGLHDRLGGTTVNEIRREGPGENGRSSSGRPG